LAIGGRILRMFHTRVLMYSAQLTCALGAVWLAIRRHSDWLSPTRVRSAADLRARPQGGGGASVSLAVGCESSCPATGGGRGGLSGSSGSQGVHLSDFPERRRSSVQPRAAPCCAVVWLIGPRHRAQPGGSSDFPEWPSPRGPYSRRTVKSNSANASWGSYGSSAAGPPTRQPSLCS
jgi:hypothetical protein